MRWPWTWKARNQLADFISDKYEARTKHLNLIESMILEQMGHAYREREKQHAELVGKVDGIAKRLSNSTGPLEEHIAKLRADPGFGRYSGQAVMERLDKLESMVSGIAARQLVARKKAGRRK